MNVGREASRLILPLGMLLLALFLAMGMIGRSQALLVVLIVAIVAFHAGRLSKELW